MNAPTDFRIPPHRGIIVASAVAATLMQTLDSTIANVALPYMQGTFSSTLDQVTWVLTSYIVAAAVMTAPVGWLAARFGRKRIFIICLAGFTLSSVLCGFATSLEQMVFYRVLQGATGAGIVPLSQAVMMDLYPMNQRGKAMAMWGMGVMVGPIIGPTLGGYLTDTFDWRYCFFINLPFGLAAIAGLAFFLRDRAPDSNMRFDWTGFIVLAIGLAALQLMLDRGAHNDWFESTEIVIYAVIAGLCTYLFLVHIWLSPNPLLPPAIFRDRNFTIGLTTMFMIGAVLVASVALLAPYLQSMAGYSAWDTGLLLAPRGAGVMFAMLIAGRIVDRYDPRVVMLAGITMLALSLWQMSRWTPDVAPFDLVVSTTLQGIGLGFIFIPMQVIAFTTLPVQYRTDGAALFSLIRNVGSAIGVSIVATMLTATAQVMHAQISETLTPFNRMAQTGGAYLFWNLANPRGRAALDSEIGRQALIVAYSNDYLIMFWITVPTALLVLFLKRPARRTGPQPAASAHAD
jgi:DHA2 family multidrug resistance protein